MEVKKKPLLLVLALCLAHVPFLSCGTEAPYSEIEVTKYGLVLENKTTLENTFWATIFIPREIKQINFSQNVEDLRITYNVSPTETRKITDNLNNNYELAIWDKPLSGEIEMRLDAIITREITLDPVSASDPYPIPENLLPIEVRPYLEPTLCCQSADQSIIEQAMVLAQNLDEEVEVVNHTVSWVNNNVQYTCPSEIEKEYGFLWSDAVRTLEFRVGVCTNFVSLTIALLRAQGIPARLAFGFLGDEHGNPGFQDPITCHVGHDWVEVYYPSAGWVRYDPTYSPTHLPYGIQVQACLGVALQALPRHWLKYNIETWEVGAIESRKVKLTYIFTLLPAAPANYTVSPPTPLLISPTDGKNMTDNTPLFDWSDVSDPSGIAYDLSIATDAGFVSIVLEKTGLTASTYEIIPAEALTLGTYYWLIRAVDCAGNVGSWSENWLFVIRALTLAEKIENMTPKEAAENLMALNRESASEALENVAPEVAGKIINASIEANLIDDIADIVCRMDPSKAASARHEAEPSSSARVMKSILRTDPETAAKIVDEGAKLDLEREASILNEMESETAVALLVMIYELPDTPEVAASLLEAMRLDSSVAAIGVLIEDEMFEYVDGLFNHLTNKRLNDIFRKLSEGQKSVLLPHLSSEVKDRISAELLPSEPFPRTIVCALIIAAVVSIGITLMWKLKLKRRQKG